MLFTKACSLFQIIFVQVKIQKIGKEFWKVHTISCHIYTIILLRSVTVSKLQVAILARLSRENLKLFVSTDSTSSHEFASQFGLAIFYMRKNTQKLSRRPSPEQVFVECAGHGLSIGSDNMSGNNSDHSGERLSQIGDNESLYLHDLKNVI